MNKDEINRKRFSIQQKNRQIVDDLANKLKLVDQGNIEKVHEFIDDVNDKLETIKMQHEELKNEDLYSQVQFQDQENSLGFTNLLKESLKQASELKKRSSNPIHFHIYD